MPEPLPSRPNWDHLFETALGQDGLFTAAQAAAAGYSPQLLVHYIRIGRVVRIRRGVYRVVHFPVAEHEELTSTWLWSAKAGVFSHQTALALHGLSDVLPAKLHLTLPLDWRRRRLPVPEGVVVHHADIPPEDRTWFGPAPVTTPRRTLTDCAHAEFSPELLLQAAQQALRRGLVGKDELSEVEVALRPFGGLAT